MSAAEQLARELRAGDRRALARAITLVESSRPEDRRAGNRLLELTAPHAGNSLRIGISGVPGVGKSTFIEALGNHVIGAGHRVAVLAVDPSSALSGGSILGDKTRMETLSRRLEAFIRPSPAGATLGGVTRHTRETIVLVEAAGFDVVLVETVGVGQSETAVADMTDLFLLLLGPAGGDELQGIKRGIVELADIVLVNKADGELQAAAQRAAGDYRSALRFLRARHAAWQVPVETCSALEGRGIVEAWTLISDFRRRMSDSGALASHRADQARRWLWAEVTSQLLDGVRNDASFAAAIARAEADVGAGRQAPRVVAEALVNQLWNTRKPS